MTGAARSLGILQLVTSLRRCCARPSAYCDHAAGWWGRSEKGADRIGKITARLRIKDTREGRDDAGADLSSPPWPSAAGPKTGQAVYPHVRPHRPPLPHHRDPAGDHVITAADPLPHDLHEASTASTAIPLRTN
jgi:hypothetical protein